MRPSQRRKIVKGLVADYRVSLRKACEVSLLSTSVWYYKAHRREDLPLRIRIRNIAETRVGYGLWRVYILLRREGWSDNHKRVYRIFKEEGLNLRSKRPRRCRAASHRSERPSFSNLHDCWSMALAFEFKKLIEIHIKEKQRISDYTELLHVNRITLNKAVKNQFNVTATHLMKQRLLIEIKDYLIHSKLTVAEIAYQLNFSEPNHLMRFFKKQTRLTTSDFLNEYQNGISS